MDLEALCSGDSATWKEVASAIRAAIRMQVRGDRSSLVEDGVQEALLGVWTRIQRDPPPDSVRLLVFAIARNKAKDIHRKIGYLRRWETSMEATELAERVSSGETPIELRILHERIASIGLMFFRKHHSDCEPLLLSRAEGMTWEELGVKIGETPVNLRQRWSRCRKHLLRHLAAAPGQFSPTPVPTHSTAAE